MIVEILYNKILIIQINTNSTYVQIMYALAEKIKKERQNWVIEFYGPEGHDGPHVATCHLYKLLEGGFKIWKNGRNAIYLDSDIGDC